MLGTNLAAHATPIRIWRGPTFEDASSRQALGSYGTLSYINSSGSKGGVAMPVRSASSSRQIENSRDDKSRIVGSIRSIARKLRTSGKQSTRVPGLTNAQLHVLRALQTNRPLSINEIADRTFTHQSSVSIVVGRLAADKLVTRSVSREDARRMSVSLTAGGRSVLRKSEDPVEKRLISALRSLDRSELRDLARSLNKVSTVLEESATTSPDLLLRA
jgi:DNA-binding MarR family transcriptional regulator